jgi:hypothetical protein
LPEGVLQQGLAPVMPPRRLSNTQSRQLACHQLGDCTHMVHGTTGNVQWGTHHSMARPQGTSSSRGCASTHAGTPLLPISSTAKQARPAPAQARAWAHMLVHPRLLLLYCYGCQHTAARDVCTAAVHLGGLRDANRGCAPAAPLYWLTICKVMCHAAAPHRCTWPVLPSTAGAEQQVMHVARQCLSVLKGQDQSRVLHTPHAPCLEP